MTLAGLLQGRDRAGLRLALQADGHALLPELLDAARCARLQCHPPAWGRLDSLEAGQFQPLDCAEAPRDGQVLVLTILLSDARGFTGGEVVMTEQRPRMQSRPMALSLRQGDGVLMAVGARQVQGARGPYRAVLRHGVARVRTGSRRSLHAVFGIETLDFPG